MRHANPYPLGSDDFEQYDDFAQHTVPLLLLLSIELRGIMAAEGLDRLLLTTRDGCLLEQLLDRLSPHFAMNFTVHRFHSSRHLGNFPSEEYLQYVRELYIEGRTLVFDMYGSFKSQARLFKSVFGETHLTRVHLYAHNEDFVLYEGATLTTRLEGFQHNIEFRFLDTVGQLLHVYFDENSNKVEFFRGPLNDYTYHTADLLRDSVAYITGPPFLHKIVSLLENVERRNLTSILSDIVAKYVQKAKPFKKGFLDSLLFWELLYPLSIYSEKFAIQSNDHASLAQRWEYGVGGRGDVIAVELQRFYNRSTPLNILLIDERSISLEVCERSAAVAGFVKREEIPSGPIYQDSFQAILGQQVLQAYFGRSNVNVFRFYSDLGSSNGHRNGSFPYCRSIGSTGVRYDLVIEGVDCRREGAERELSSRLLGLSAHMESTGLHVLIDASGGSSCASSTTPKKGRDISEALFPGPPSATRRRRIKCCPVLLGKRCVEISRSINNRRQFFAEIVHHRDKEGDGDDRERVCFLEFDDINEE